MSIDAPVDTPTPGRQSAEWPDIVFLEGVSQKTLGQLTEYWILKKHPQTHGHTTRPRFSLTTEAPRAYP